MSSVSLRDVHKSYAGGSQAVRGIDLDIANGEFVTIVGPSGCGKSTLLNLIAGLDTPTQGIIRIDDDVVTDWPPRARDIAMVFQSYALYPHMNVRRNIGFALEIAGVARREREQRVLETAARLEIEPLLDRKPGELSGGQRQRVALGRALVRRPRVFLFDEPLSNLDVTLRMQMRAELKKLHEELRATFVYVTHDQSEAMTLSDRVVVLNEGRIQQVAPPREVHAHPANMFVAGFFGAPRINFVEPATLGFPAGPRGALIGVRPADVRVWTESDASDQAATAQGRVYLVEPMGSETWVTVEMGAERMTGRAPGDFAASSGTPARLEIDRARVLWFDRATGARMDPTDSRGAAPGLQPAAGPA